MLNVNKYLQNSHQLDLMGKNISTYYYDCNNKENESLNYWGEVNFAMQGRFIIGFETEVSDFINLDIKIDEKSLKFKINSLFFPVFTLFYRENFSPLSPRFEKSSVFTASLPLWQDIKKCYF